MELIDVKHGYGYLLEILERTVSLIFATRKELLEILVLFKHKVCYRRP